MIGAHMSSVRRMWRRSPATAGVDAQILEPSNVARSRTAVWSIVLVVALMIIPACGGKKPPIARPVPPPPTTTPSAPPAPPEPVAEPTPVTVPPEPGVESSDLSSKTLDEINRQSPLQPVFFEFDSAELSADGQRALTTNGEVLKQNASWVISIEGHCDERGTAEYNLALGERRALAARAYLVSLGIAPDRLRTVSYGKEFPFDPGHSEEAWAKNRRAHFVVTAK
jgi:peptidoglycan-associated lipoprotein